MATKEPPKDDNDKEQENVNDKGITRKSKICTQCKKRHYTKNEICFTCTKKETELKIKETNGKKCTKCPNIHTQKTVTCGNCNERAANYRNEKREEKIEEMANNKCIWQDRNNMQCRTNKINDTDYCNLHQYVKDYTQEEKDKSVICSGCHKKKYCGFKDDGTPRNTCDKCANRTKAIKKEDSKNSIKCNGNAETGKLCSSKALTNEQYCGKHITYANYLKHAKENNKKLCKFITHYSDCEKYIPINSNYVTCEHCRKKDNKKKN